MSLPAVLNRIAELQQVLAPPAPPATPPGTAFAGTLQGAMGTGGAAATATLPGLLPAHGVAGAGTPAGQAMVNLARNEIGVTESPPGSNDSPRIAQFRQATAGAGVGPWCAYFVSWAAREAGAPIGDRGQGHGLVADVWSWGQRTGKSLPAGSTPQPGDLIVWPNHIGIVEAVLPDGRVQTIEGNSSDQVSRRTHEASSALGYVRMG